MDAGRWRDGFTPQTQADWLGTYAPLALCKHYVHTVRWAHFSDADAHQFPHCGLVDATGQIKPALLRLRDRPPAQDRLPPSSHRRFPRSLQPPPARKAWSAWPGK